MNYPENEVLKLIPLSRAEVEMYLLPDCTLEKYFNLREHPRVVPENVQQALRGRVLKNIDTDPANYLFHTLWIVTDKTINTLVAGITIKGLPDENGEVELGAGTLDGFMNRGYMTGATKLMCEWVLKQPGVKLVMANSRPDNFASHRTLEKSGFSVIEKRSENWKWKYSAASLSHP